MSGAGLGEREAEFLRNYSKQVTLLHVGSPNLVLTEDVLKLRGIERLPVDVADLTIRQNRMTLSSAQRQPGF